MKRWAALMLLVSSVLSFAGASHAAVSASVDKNPLLAGEILQLTITSDRSNDEPDLGTLSEDFEILGRSTSSQFQIVNGRSSRNYQTVYRLRPRRLGTLRIPPIEIDGERSQAIAVEVRKPDTQAGQWPEAFIEFTADKSQAWLREQVILDVRLFVRGNLVSGNFGQPSAEQVVIEALGEQTQSQELRGPHRYNVFQRRYALFAEQSGALTINGPIFNGELAVPGQRSGIFGMGQARRPVYASAQALSLEILAPPAGLGGPDWLPARSVRLLEELQPDTTSLQLGEPLTRTIRLQVDGQLHTQLPALEISNPAGAQAYTEPPRDQTQSNGATLIASREYSSAIIPGQGRELVLPAVELKWWNSASNQLETARIEERRIALRGLPATPPAAATAPPVSSTTTASTTAPPEAGGRNWWQIIALSCAAGWLGTVLAWLWSTRVTTRVARPQRKPEAIRKILRHAPASECRSALQHWARQRTGRYHSLSALAQLTSDAQARQSLYELDAAACGRGESFDRDGLIRLLDTLAQDQREHSALPPLYPES